MAYDFKLDTPEVIQIDYTPAGIGSRGLAAMIDYLAMLGIGIVLLIVCILLATAGAEVLATVLGLTGAFVIFWGYYIIYETVWRGQTPGKRAVHIRVLKNNGYPITFVDAVVRNILRIADFLPSFYAVGIVVMFVSPQGRRLGDYAAGTVVVKESRPVTLEQLATEARASAPPYQRQPSVGEVDPDEYDWNLDALSETQLTIVREFLGRASNLQPEVRNRIGSQIAARIAPTISAREPFDPTRFLHRVVILYEARNESRSVPS